MKLVVSVFAACALIASTAEATEYFVNIGRGKGKDGTKEKPAKDLGNLVAKLVAGDVVNIADGARAQARMVNLAMAVRVQREAGIAAEETVKNFTDLGCIERLAFFE
jgi:hypothetical protein